jgi:hypothetical protein
MEAVGPQGNHREIAQWSCPKLVWDHHGVDCVTLSGNGWGTGKRRRGIGSTTFIQGATLGVGVPPSVYDQSNQISGV